MIYRQLCSQCSVPLLAGLAPLSECRAEGALQNQVTEKALKSLPPPVELVLIQEQPYPSFCQNNKKNNNPSINDFIQIGLSVVPKSIYTHTAFLRASSEFPTVQTQDVLNSEDLAKEGCSHGALILALQHREHYWCYQTVRHRVGYKVVVISSLCNSGPKPQKDLLVHVLILLQNILWFSAKNKRTTTATPKPSRSSPFGTGQRNDRPGRSCEVSHPVPLRTAPPRPGRAPHRRRCISRGPAERGGPGPARLTWSARTAPSPPRCSCRRPAPPGTARLLPPRPPPPRPRGSAPGRRRPQAPGRRPRDPPARAPRAAAAPWCSAPPAAALPAGPSPVRGAPPPPRRAAPGAG